MNARLTNAVHVISEEVLPFIPGGPAMPGSPLSPFSPGMTVAFDFPGAGGGYSGGGVLENQGQTIAGGGGSFNSGGNPIKKKGVKEGNGNVIITLVDPELP